MFNQRDVVLLPFPYSDLSGSKKRPAVIISNKKLNKSEDRICCLITSNSSKDGIFIKNNYFESGELPFKSWIKPYRLFTVNENIINKKLGTLTKEFHSEIISAVSEYYKLEP